MDVVERYRLLEIPGWMEDVELRWLHARAARTRGKIIEVGCYLGRTTCAILAGLPQHEGTRLTCVDTFDGRGTTAPVSDQMRRLSDNITQRQLPAPYILACESTRAAQSVSVRGAEWVFIDASHDYANVRADLAAWLPNVAAGGVISGHDYGADWPGVTQAVDEMFGRRVKRPVGSVWEVAA